MMDANGDMHHPTTPDRNLLEFVESTNLEDVFYKKFKHSPRTFMWGTKRLDYILVDPALTPAVERIGYLGTHDGSDTDHVYAFMDLNDRIAHQGIIHRPVTTKSREFTLTQSDKVKTFLDGLVESSKNETYKERVDKLARSFHQHGPTPDNKRKYQQIYNSFIELAGSHASKVARRKFGYERSPELTQRGAMLLIHKHILDCKHRNSPLTPSIQRRATVLGVNPQSILNQPAQHIRREVTKLRRELWTTQKECKETRIEWLNKIAQDRARAENIPNWETKIKQMIKDAHERAINRKLTIATKGAHRPLDSIQIPVHNWFYSEQQNELYQYEQGNFKAYPPTIEGTAHMFKTHHTLKVLPPDAILVQVKQHTNQTQIIGVTPNPTQTWRDITTPTEMERLLLERNKRHLQQTIIEGGTCNTYPMPLFRQKMGINDQTDDLLRGQFTAEYDIPPPVTAWIKAVTQTDTEQALPEVVGSLSKAEFQQMFKQKKESVSSDPHGINYTVWKAMAKSDYLSSFLCTLVSLPFIYGYANTRWMNMIDVMLEKKPGVRNIHMLRIIGLVCPEFNTALSYFIGHLGQKNFEQTLPTDEQHGSRRNRQSIDAAMLKLLTMETARAGMRTIAMTQYDEKNCFDRIFRQNSNIFAQKARISKNILTARTLVKDNMKRRVKTCLGITEGTYHQIDGEPTLDGEIQGTADTPLLFSMLSNVAIQAHKSYTPGLTLESPTLKRKIHHHNIAYVDDADGHVSADYNSTNPTEEATTKMNLSAQGWNDVNNLTGGSLAYHKTKWQMIAWEEVGSIKKLVRTTTQQLRIKDWTGAPTTINYGPTDEPNIGLGFHLCPNGDQSHQFNHTHNAIQNLCKNVTIANLSEREALQTVTQRLVPKLHYPLHLTSFTRKQTDKINTQVRRTFLPPMRFNRHLPAAVLYGPMSMGGMEFPEAYTMQDQAQIPYLLKQLRWDKTVANDILVTLDHIQLISGFVVPILDSTTKPINYIDNSFLLSIRHRLSEINGSLWIERAWSPPLQREGDSSIMEAFTQIPRITTSMLRRANTVRLYLRVITIADITNPEGTTIPDGMLNGDWQAGTDLLWPQIPCPPKPYWATFRKCMRATFCTLAPQHQPSHFSVRLDRQLGPWYPVKRNTWHQCYKTKQNLYLRQLEGTLITILSPSKIKGYYHSTGTVTDIPIESHPIAHQQIGNSVWTQRPMNLSLDISHDSPPPGHLVNNTLTDPTTERLILGSDGSLHLHEQVASAAWIISSGPDSFLSATFIMESINSLTSHRIELEGIFRALHHLDYLNMSPKMVDQWCDNLQAVKDSDRPIQDPSGMLKAEADIILAIHHIKNRNPYQTRIRHVYGHQDTKRDPTQTKILDKPILSASRRPYSCY